MVCLVVFSLSLFIYRREEGVVVIVFFLFWVLVVLKDIRRFFWVLGLIGIWSVDMKVGVGSVGWGVGTEVVRREIFNFYYIFSMFLFVKVSIYL